MHITYYQKAIQLTALWNIRFTKIIDMSVFVQIVEHCGFMYMGRVFKVSICILFFLRMSNFILHSLATFLPLRQLVHGDIVFKRGKIVVLIKWTKTQKSRKLITIPKRHVSPLLPV